MRWQRVARVAVAIVGLGCAVAIFLYTRNRHAPAAPPTSLERVDPNAALEGSEGLTMLFKVGRSPINMKFGSTRTYDDGRARWEKVEINGLEETRYTVQADVVETRGKAAPGERPSHLDLSGHVVLVTDDGLRLETDKASYEEATSQLTIPGPVTFARGRMSGEGVGAAYDRQRDVMTVLDKATARVAPDDKGQGAAVASSTRMSLVRGQKTLRLEGNARVVGESQTLTANEATFVFTEDESAVKFLEMRGAARVVPDAGGAADRPAMSADNITMGFHPDGRTLQHATLTGHAVLTIAGTTTRAIRASWIDLFTGTDGRTLTQLNAKDRTEVELGPTATSPGRKITANVLIASGNDKQGLTSARFEGDPRFEELPAAGARQGSGAPAGSMRKGRATTLVLVLGGQLDAIQRAEFQQDAVFETGEVTGWADLAHYDDANGQLRLLANERNPRKKSRVKTTDLQVDAWTIEVKTESQDLDARGDVTTQTTTAAGAAKEKEKGTLFSGDQPVVGGADTLTYTQSSGKAIYTGSAKAQATLRQGQTSVVGNQIVFFNASRSLTADGAVDTTWIFEEPAGETKPAAEGKPAPADIGKPALTNYRVRAETFSYDEAKRTAAYGGPTVILTTADVTIESRTLTFTLAAESRTLETMRAHRGKGDEVYARLSDGHEATADELVYDAKTEVYTLRGKPARAKKPKEAEPGDKTKPALAAQCGLEESTVLELNRRTGALRTPGAGEAPRATLQVPCSYPMRRQK